MKFKGSAIPKEIIDYCDKAINEQPVPEMPELDIEIYVKNNGEDISTEVYQEIAKSSASLKKAVAKRLRYCF